MRVLLSCPVFLSKGQTFQQFCTKHTGNRCERIQKRPLFYRIHDVDKKIPDFHAIMWGTFLPVPLRFVPCAKWLTDRCRIFSLHFNRLALHCELILNLRWFLRLYFCVRCAWLRWSLSSGASYPQKRHSSRPRSARPPPWTPKSTSWVPTNPLCQTVSSKYPSNSSWISF